MKQVITYSILFLSSVVAAAQPRKLTFQAGPQVSIAAADLRPGHSMGIGVNAKLGYPIGKGNSLTGRLGYTFLPGRKFTTTYEVVDGGGGGSYSYEQKSKGMNDINLMGGITHDWKKWFTGADVGLCLGLMDGMSETSGAAAFEFGYIFGPGEDNSPFLQMLAAYFGICGDPKIQIGLRYYIRF